MKKLLLIFMFLPFIGFGQSDIFGEKTGCISGNCGNGDGVYVWKSGDTYKGEYKAYQFHGKGTYTWADGSKYVGEWKGGYKHGQGAIHNSYGALTKKGKWINDVYQKPAIEACNRKSKLAIAD
jgi:hypothetical protein